MIGSGTPLPRSPLATACAVPSPPAATATAPSRATFAAASLAASEPFASMISKANRCSRSPSSRPERRRAREPNARGLKMIPRGVRLRGRVRSEPTEGCRPGEWSKAGSSSGSIDSEPPATANRRARSESMRNPGPSAQDVSRTAAWLELGQSVGLTKRVNAERTPAAPARASLPFPAVADRTTRAS